MKILAIETSCDETAASIVEAKIPAKGWSTSGGKNEKLKIKDIKILSNIVSSQVDLHQKYGGVYPELAARAHLENIIPTIKAGLEKANCKLADIDLIAVTIGPGLIGSLLIGVETAKTLAMALNKPIMGVNHWLGHIYSCFAVEVKSQKEKVKTTTKNLKPPEFPLLALIVSGGHTGLVLMKSHQDLKEIGQTLDDSAGEAFDKVAALLDLPYPGGPAIEKEAKKLLTTIDHRLTTIKLPRPMLDSCDFNFSFSGLKTAVLYLTKKLGPAKTKKLRPQIAAEFQQAVIDALIAKTLKAAQRFKVKSICLSGGVSANKELRKQMAEKITQSLNRSITFHCPPMKLSTDNAAMITIASAFQPKKTWTNYSKIQANANLKI